MIIKSDLVKILIILSVCTIKETFQIDLERCSLCRNPFSFEAGLQKHISEATITSNCTFMDKKEILKENFCKGSIFGGCHVLTSASCFLNHHNPQEFCVYLRYLNIKNNVNFLKMFISNITIHPEFKPNNFSKNSTENDLAVIKLENRIEFDDLYLGWSKLPDDVIKTENFEDNDCFISGYITRNSGDVQVFSVKVEILQREECLDISLINNITINTTDYWKYCVLTQGTNRKAVFYANGKGIICKNIITALMSPISYELHDSLLFPVVDIGEKSTWIRSTMLSLRLVKSNVIKKRNLAVRIDNGKESFWIFLIMLLNVLL